MYRIILFLGLIALAAAGAAWVADQSGDVARGRDRQDRAVLPKVRRADHEEGAAAEALQAAAVGADPKVAFTVFTDAGNQIAGQAVGAERPIGAIWR